MCRCVENKESSIIVNIIKSVHRVLFFVTPSLPPKIALWKFWFLTTPYENPMHHNQHFKKHTVAIDPLPPAFSVYSFENVDNSGRPVRQYIGCEVFLMWRVVFFLVLAGYSTGLVGQRASSSGQGMLTLSCVLSTQCDLRGHGRGTRISLPTKLFPWSNSNTTSSKVC